MATYPVTGGDDAGLLDAVNYAVSGPSGIGQQLQGFSSSEGTRLTGNFNVPFTNNGNFLPTAAVLYVEPIPLSTSEWLDDYTWKYTFTATQFYPPFALGAGVSISGVTPSEYDSIAGITANRFRRTGVVECSTDYVILRSSEPLPNPGVVGTGGDAGLWVTSDPDPNTGGTGAVINTDANAIVSVDAGNNLVSVTGQLYLAPFDYAVFETNYPLNVPGMSVYVKLNRYRATNTGTVAIPQYSYEFDAVIASEQIYSADLTAYTQGVPTSYNIISGTSGPASIGSYNAFPISTTGDGTGGSIFVDVIANSTNYTTSLDNLQTYGGGNYAIGDQVTFSGAELGGSQPANDLVLEVATLGGTGDINLFNSVTGTSDPTSAGTYTNVNPSSTSGSGTGAQITLITTTAGTAYNTGSTITITNGGSGYKVGDTLTFDGLLLGGLSGINDLVFKVFYVSSTGDIEAPESLTIFTPIVDAPPSGLYQYIIQVEVNVDYGAQVAVKSMFVGRRSLTAQVIKK